MGMEHGTGPAAAHDFQVQGRFSAGLARALNHLACGIDHDQVGRLHLPLVDAARGHQQLQGILLLHTTEIAAGAVAPAPGMDGRHGSGELIGQGHCAGG